MSGRDPIAALVEFPADDPNRAVAFWEGLLGVDLTPRTPAQGEGWQSPDAATTVGVHARGAGPGDRFSLPYFRVADVHASVARVRELGGDVIHSGERSAVCRDSEGTPFGLMLDDATTK